MQASSLVEVSTPALVLDLDRSTRHCQRKTVRAGALGAALEPNSRLMRLQ
jgi:D-serine deaminase-like pyridoxal phosphate-dependent protein